MIRQCAAQAEENSCNSAFSPINTTEAPQITLVFTSKRILYIQVHICSYKWMTNVLHHTTGSEVKPHLCHFQPITPNHPYVLFIDILHVYQSTRTGHQCTKNGDSLWFENRTEVYGTWWFGMGQSVITAPDHISKNIPVYLQYLFFFMLHLIVKICEDPFNASLPFM